MRLPVAETVTGAWVVRVILIVLVKVILILTVIVTGTAVR